MRNKLTQRGLPVGSQALQEDMQLHTHGTTYAHKAARPKLRQAKRGAWRRTERTGR